MLVFMALVLHSDQNRSCWPSQSTIAKRTGLSRQTVIRSLRALAADGLITSTHRGGRSVKTYQLRKPMDCANVNPEGYIKDSDVTFGTVDVTFGTVDVNPEGYTNREQKEQYIFNTSSSLALADQIRQAEIQRTGSGHVGDYRSALIRQMHPLGDGQFAVPSSLDKFAEEIRPSIRAVIGRDPSFVFFDGVWK